MAPQIFKQKTVFSAIRFMHGATDFQSENGVSRYQVHAWGHRFSNRKRCFPLSGSCMGPQIFKQKTVFSAIRFMHGATDFQSENDVSRYQVHARRHRFSNRKRCVTLLVSAKVCIGTKGSGFFIIMLTTIFMTDQTAQNIHKLVCKWSCDPIDSMNLVELSRINSEDTEFLRSQHCLTVWSAPRIARTTENHASNSL